MAVARTHSIALLGIEGLVVEIEADISSGLPAFVVVGLPDAALGEAQHRVRAAASNSGCPITRNHLTINLSPASLPKHGSAFDLAIAIAAFAADGLVSAESVGSVVHLGELGLDGQFVVFGKYALADFIFQIIINNLIRRLFHVYEFLTLINHIYEYYTVEYMFYQRSNQKK